MLKKWLCVLIAAVLLLGMTACTPEDKKETTVATVAPGQPTPTPTPEPELPYEYGLGVTFRSKDPVTYSMSFSDASWYPMTDKWKTEGVFAKITELTNVTLDITSYDSGSYTDSITLDISSGEASYIIPKVYDESKFISGGAVVAVSDYVQYMPNFTDFVEKYKMQPDIDTIVRADGKFYRLPGMLETPLQDYTIMVRNDLFTAAGYDVKELEKTWTWEDLYNALVDVKAYMVSQGTVAATDYIWSDLWCGATSGQNNGGNLLKVMGASYGVPSGWAVGNGMEYNADNDEWYFASISDDYKEFVTMVNKFVKGGILDPETFTQEDNTATSKWFNGKTAIISVNRSKIAEWRKGLNDIVGTKNTDTYVAVSPMGSKNTIAERNRLENGVMISTKALEDLGEEGFIQMMRFVDWLFYSPEAYTLIKWGVEGETYSLVKDGLTGKMVKVLLPGFKCGGLGINGTSDQDIDIRLEWGYAGGNFWYGHSLAEMSDNFSRELTDFYARIDEYRDLAVANPPVKSNEDQQEQLGLWQGALIDNVNTWTLQFITGKKDITADWDEYVQSCKDLNCDEMVEMINEIHKG